MSVTDILVDFAIASFFIAVGQLLRAKVPLVQKFFIPPSMIAGFIALALGAQGLGILPFSENIGSYASVLIILIFAGVGINGFSFNKKDFKAEIDRIGSYFSYKVLAQAIQFSLAPVFSIRNYSRTLTMASVCCWQLVSPADTERQRLLVPRLRDWVIWMQWISR